MENTVTYPKKSNLKFLPSFIVYQPNNKTDIFLNEELAFKFFNSIKEGAIWKKTDDGTHFLETFIQQKIATFQ